MRDPDGEEPDDSAAARGSARQGEVRYIRVTSVCRLHTTVHYLRIGSMYVGTVRLTALLRYAFRFCYYQCRPPSVHFLSSPLLPF